MFASRRAAMDLGKQFSPTDPVHRIMAWPVVSVPEGATLRRLSQVLDEERIGAALVITDTGEPGIVTEVDVVAALAAGADPDEVWSGDVMTTELVTVRSDSPIIEAAEAMHENRIRHVLVQEAGECVGLVSIRDVLAVLLGHVEE
jgi:CBS domain-containing protein